MDHKTSLRRQARELALQILFQQEFAEEISIESSLAYFKNNIKAPQEVWSYSEFLLLGIQNNRQAIDAKLSQASLKWSLSRMSLVDKNTLRIALFEIFFSEDKIVPAIAINESIEVVKKYGNTDSPAFVNGILVEATKGSIE